MDIWFEAAQRLAATLPGYRIEEIRVPARQSACDCYDKGLPLPDVSAFGGVFGVPLVQEMTIRGNRILFAFTDAFYGACVEEINQSLPFPATDYGDVALNRMLRNARQGGQGCPADPCIQRALWLCAGCTRAPSLARQAATAYLTMLHDKPVQARQTLLHACGPLSAACARLYARLY